MLSYANTYLASITPDLMASIAAKISLWDLCQFSRFEWPGARRTGWTFPGMLRQMPPKLGSLWWPRDASRFAIGLYLATDIMVQNIRSQLQAVTISPTTGQTIAYGPGKLVISEENQNFTTVGKITATMWMLPVRPLFDIINTNGLNLLTLVDDRYFWYFRDTKNIEIVQGETTWEDLFDELAPAMGVNIDYNDISFDYLTPGAGLAAQYEQSPMLLDAIAYNVGQRIVVDLDGTVNSLSREASQEILQENINQLAQYDPSSLFIQGGGFFNSKDEPLLLPSFVRVAFPCSVGNVDLGQSYEITIALADLNVAELGTLGNGNTKTFHDTAAAEGAISTTAPGNVTALTTLATRIATDWYLYQLGPIDAKFEGIVEWGMEGLSDAVEWIHVNGEISTRVYRPAWNDLTEELLHGVSPEQPPAWIKVISSSSSTITLTSGSSRNITAKMYNGSALVDNLDADFTDSDLGAAVSGTGIPGGTTIISIESSDTAILSNAATVTIDADTLTITDTGLTTTGYAAVVERWVNVLGEWQYWDSVGKDWVQDTGSIDWSMVTSSVWLQEVNGEVSRINTTYQCRLLGFDEDGVPIWATAAGPTAIAIINSGPNSDGLYDATIQFYTPQTGGPGTWTSGTNIWLRDANA